MYKKGGAVWGYSNSSHVHDAITKKGRNGYVFINGRVAISWRSSLLETVTYSSCESEYVALCCAGNEVMYLGQIRAELGVAAKLRVGGWVVLVLGDNESSMKVAENPVFHRRSKYIDIKWHSIRERVAKGEIVLRFVKSEEQAANMLTKAVSIKVLKNPCSLIGLQIEK